MLELKTIETMTVQCWVFVASDLDDSLQAVSNAEFLWNIDQLTKSAAEITELDSYTSYVSEGEGLEEIKDRKQRKESWPREKGSVYQVRMVKEYHRLKGEKNWKLYDVDFDRAIKVGA